MTAIRARPWRWRSLCPRLTGRHARSSGLESRAELVPPMLFDARQRIRSNTCASRHTFRFRVALVYSPTYPAFRMGPEKAVHALPSRNCVREAVRYWLGCGKGLHGLGATRKAAGRSRDSSLRPPRCRRSGPPGRRRRRGLSPSQRKGQAPTRPAGKSRRRAAELSRPASGSDGRRGRCMIGRG